MAPFDDSVGCCLHRAVVMCFVAEVEEDVVGILEELDSVCYRVDYVGDKEQEEDRSKNASLYNSCFFAFPLCRCCFNFDSLLTIGQVGCES